MQIKDVLCANETKNILKKGDFPEYKNEMARILSSLYFFNNTISKDEVTKIIKGADLEAADILKEDMAEKDMCNTKNKKCLSCECCRLRRIEEELFLYYLLSRETDIKEPFITSLRVKPNIQDIRLYMHAREEIYSELNDFLQNRDIDFKKSSEFFVLKNFLENKLKVVYKFSDEEMKYPRERITKMLSKIETKDGVQKIYQNYQNNKEIQREILSKIENETENMSMEKEEKSFKEQVADEKAETKRQTEEFKQEIKEQVTEELLETKGQVEEKVKEVGEEGIKIEKTEEKSKEVIEEKNIEEPLKITSGIPASIEKEEMSNVSISLESSLYEKESLKKDFENLEINESLKYTEPKVVQMDKFFIPDCKNIDVKGQKDCDKYGYYFLAQKVVFFEYINPSYAILFQTEQNIFYHLNLTNEYVAYAFSSVLKSGAYRKVSWDIMSLEKENKWTINNIVPLKLVLRLLEKRNGTEIKIPSISNSREQIFNNISLYNTIYKNINLKELEDELIFERLVARSDYKELLDGRWTFNSKVKDGYNVLFARINNLLELGIDSYDFYKKVLINIGRKEKIAQGVEILNISEKGLILQILPEQRIKLNDLIIHRLDVLSKEILKEFIPNISISWK